jgi:hypothetical protein
MDNMAHSEAVAAVEGETALVEMPQRAGGGRKEEGTVTRVRRRQIEI